MERYTFAPSQMICNFPILKSMICSHRQFDDARAEFEKKVGKEQSEKLIDQFMSEAIRQVRPNYEYVINKMQNLNA